MNFIILTKNQGAILGPIAEIFGWIMDFLFKITSQVGILNIGLCIILFTIVTRLLLFPLTVKQQKTSKLMNVMQPELNAIQKKYKGKTEDELFKIIWDEIKKLNTTFPRYKHIQNMILSSEELIKTTTKKIKRQEEMKRIVGAPFAGIPETRDTTVPVGGNDNTNG